MAKSRDEQKRLKVLLALLAVVALGAVVMTLRGGGLTGAASKVAQLDYQPHHLPALQLGAGAERVAEVGGGERNPFTFGAPPTPTPAPRTPMPTRPPVVRTPPPTPTPRLARGADGQPKPPPPPFNREYIGHFGPLDLQVAAFRRHGSDAGVSDIEVAPVGEVLDGVYIVREIGLESVLIGYVGYDRSEDTRVPLAEK